MKPKIQVEFVITGIHIPPDEITRQLNLEPTCSWLKGDSIQGTNLRRKHNGWCFSIENRQDGLEIEEYILPLINALSPSAQLIRQICKEYEMSSEISCVIYMSDETPVINLSPQVLSTIVDLGAAIDVDIILSK